MAATTETPANPTFDPTGMTPIYAKKTIDGRGAPREVDDKSKVLGYMKNNGDGTYSNYSTTGTLEKTYNPNTGLLGGLSQNLNAIADDRSKVLSDFVLPATLMGVGAGLVGDAGVTGAVVATETAGGGSGLLAGGVEAMPVEVIGATGSGATGVTGAVGATETAAGGAGGGLLAGGVEAMPVEVIGATGSGATGVTGAGVTGGVVGGVTGATTAGTVAGATTGGLLTNGLVTGAGLVAGALGGGNTTTTQTQSRDPWEPAQQYLRDNLQTNANMQANYLKNPFSNEQKAAYQNYANILANSNANVPVMSQISNNFLASRRGQMPTMPQFTNGATSGAIDWSQYENMGLLK